jgi:hypothetical protein
VVSRRTLVVGFTTLIRGALASDTCLSHIGIASAFNQILVRHQMLFSIAVCESKATASTCRVGGATIPRTNAVGRGIATAVHCFSIGPEMEITFSVWTQFTVPTGTRTEHLRGMPLVARMFASSEVKAKQRRGIQWHPRV